MLRTRYAIRRLLGWRFAPTILVLFAVACGAPEPSPSGDGAVTVLDGGLEQDWRVSAELLTSVDGYSFVYDHLDDELLVFLGDDVLDPARIDEAAEQHPAVASSLERYTATSFTAADNRMPASTFRREDDSRGHVSFAGGNGAERNLDVRALAGGYLADAWLIKTLSDSFYVHHEELTVEQRSVNGVDVDALLPIGVLSKFSSSGELEAYAAVTISIPRGRVEYFQVDDNGTAVYLVYRDGEMQPETLTLHPPGVGAAMVPGANNVQPADTTYLEQWEAVVRGHAQPLALEEQKPVEISREQILANANQVLGTRWALSRENYAPDRPEQCPGDKWRRPNRLVAGDIGKELRAPPYKWGGHMGLADFTDGIAAGKTAGDVCTCRCRRQDMGQCTLDDWCIVPDTVGLDCSGFVSLVWEMPYHSTVTIPQIADSVGWQDLKPGDALNKPGNHVRLFLGFDNTDALSFRIAESSTGCGGVCEQSMRVSQLSGYIPYRYRNVANSPASP